MTITDDTLKAGVANAFEGLNVVHEDLPDHYVLSSGLQRSTKNPKILKEWKLDGDKLVCCFFIDGSTVADHCFEYTRFEDRYYRSNPGPGHQVRVIHLNDKVPELA